MNLNKALIQEGLSSLNKSAHFFKPFNFLFFVILLCNFSQAKDIIELTAGYSKPPFVIESSLNDKRIKSHKSREQHNGIQLDLVNAIFAVEKQPVKFIYMSLARSFTSVDKWHSDGIITLPNDYEHQGVYVSDPYIQYQNVVVTLAEEQLSINKLSDLAGKKIIAFQTAKAFLGSDFSNAIEHAKEYREMPNQMKQINMLFSKRTQALVLDINIFKYYIYNHSEAKYQKAYKVHHLFVPRIYSAGFSSIALRDQFNRGLKVIKANGKYQQILDKYLL